MALGIDDFTGTVGGNVSGTSDLAPLDQQAAMILELFPDAKTVGLLYCSAEANSQYQVDTVKAVSGGAGLYLHSVPLRRLQRRCRRDPDRLRRQRCDLCAHRQHRGRQHRHRGTTSASPPACRSIAGEEGICKGCGVATLSISYYDLGVTTGKMAAKILTGEANISEMPIEYAENFTPEVQPRGLRRTGRDGPRHLSGAGRGIRFVFSKRLF